MTTTDEARVTDEEIAREIESWLRVAPTSKTTRVLSELADRLAARERQLDLACQDVTELRKERAEMVALLEAINVDGYRDGLSEWDERRRTMLAKHGRRTP